MVKDLPIDLPSVALQPAPSPHQVFRTIQIRLLSDLLKLLTVSFDFLVQFLVLVPLSDGRACEDLVPSESLLEQFLDFFLCFFCTDLSVDSTDDHCVSGNESVYVLFLGIELVLAHLGTELKQQVVCEETVGVGQQNDNHHCVVVVDRGSEGQLVKPRKIPVVLDWCEDGWLSKSRV